MSIEYILPKNDEVFGVWITDTREDGKKYDVHAYLSRLFGIVIGYNGEYIYGNDLAISFKDRKITFQYFDNKNDLKQVDLPEEVFTKLYLEFLQKIKEKVYNPSTETQE
jgi:hypothetical protein